MKSQANMDQYQPVHILRDGWLAALLWGFCWWWDPPLHLTPSCIHPPVHDDVSLPTYVVRFNEFPQRMTRDKMLTTEWKIQLPLFTETLELVFSVLPELLPQLTPPTSSPPRLAWSRASHSPPPPLLLCVFHLPVKMCKIIVFRGESKNDSPLLQSTSFII